MSCWFALLIFFWGHLHKCLPARMVTSCISYLSSCCDKNPNRSNWREGVHFGSQFQVTVHHSREVKAARARGSLLDCIPIRKQRVNNAGGSPVSQPTVQSTLRLSFPTLINPIWELFVDTPRGLMSWWFSILSSWQSKLTIRLIFFYCYAIM